MKEYGQEVLATPKSQVSWLLPSLAVVGGLGVLVGLGRRWIIHRGATPPAAPAADAPSPEDDDYADRLDDELSRTD